MLDLTVNAFAGLTAGALPGPAVTYSRWVNVQHKRSPLAHGILVAVKLGLSDKVTSKLRKITQSPDLACKIKVTLSPGFIWLLGVKVVVALRGRLCPVVLATDT